MAGNNSMYSSTHIEWDDDERSLNTKYLSMSYRKNQQAAKEYTPSITQIMKEFYDEEKAKLYSFNYTDHHKDFQVNNQQDYAFENSSSDTESYYTDDSASEHKSDTESSEEVLEDSNDPLVKIMDDAIYKKFSYV